MFSLQDCDNLIKNGAEYKSFENLYAFRDTSRVVTTERKYETPTFSNFARIGYIEDVNPLNRKIYNYSVNVESVVHGMTFAQRNYELFENKPDVSNKVIDNSYELNRPITNNDFNDIINVSTKTIYRDNRVEIKPVEHNTYLMSDMIKEADSSQVIEFKPIPQERALTKPSKIRSFIYNSIETVKNLKNSLMKNKVR